jgi:murein tripeptide amidase MpaA
MNKKKLFVVLLFVFCVFAKAEDDEFGHFSGYKVVRANIKTQQQIQTISKLGVDVWSHHSTLRFGLNDIMIRDAHFRIFDSEGIDYEVIIDDVETRIQNEHNELKNRAPFANFFTAYHTFDEIVAFLSNLTTVYSKIATYVPSIGKSIEGRDIPAVIINAGKSTKKVWLSGGQHAREWVSHSTTLYLLNELVTGYGTNPNATAILDKASFVIVPVVNPDGYVFTWASANNRLWRKNRRVNSNGSYGVDLNRNWNDHWCESGASKTPSDDTYCGTAAFSEPESKATAAYVTKNLPIDAAIDLHSYSQLILRPYGWAKTNPPNEATLKTFGDGMAAAIKARHGKTYTSEHIYDLYLASGSIEDWQLTEAKIPLAYTIELRDTGLYGFLLPANQIIPTGEEIFSALTYVVANLK